MIGINGKRESEKSIQAARHDNDDDDDIPDILTQNTKEGKRRYILMFNIYNWHTSGIKSKNTWMCPNS